MGYQRHNEDRAPLPGSGHLEDYTLSFLITAGALCFVLLFVIWAAWGLPATLALAYLADRALIRL